MKRLMVLLVLALVSAACGRRQAEKPSQPASSAATPVSGPFSASELQAFTALEPIDTHTHVYQNNPAFYAMLYRLHMHILDICVDDDHSSFQKNLPLQIKDVLEVVHASDGHAAFCTTFDPYKFRQRGFTQAAIRQINHNFDQGAVAVKIWKNVGMEIKDAQGRYILPDNPIFEPIYKDIAAHHRTLIAHLADPNSLWEPPQSCLARLLLL